jgi:hypothetical protein
MAPMHFDAATGNWVGDSSAFAGGWNVLVIPESGRAARGEAPQSVAIEPSGFVAWAPQHGPILLFDLKHSKRPIARFGEDESTWQNVVFRSGADAVQSEGRVVATSAAGETRAWRYFTDDQRLLDFVTKQLPFDAGAQMDPKQFCADDVGTTRLSEVNPAIAPSCTK